MKTLIIGLFSLTLFASGAAWSQSLPPVTPKPLGTGAAVPAVCNNTKGVLIIVVNKFGNVQPFYCGNVLVNRVKKVIKKTDQLDPFKSWIKGAEIDLGTVTRFQASGETDPCVWWNIGGRSYVFCW